MKQRLYTGGANQGASQREKCLVDMSISFVANFESSRRVEPGNRTIGSAPCLITPVAKGCPDYCEHWCNAAFSQALSMRLGTVASVTLNDFRFVQGTSSLASNVRNGLNANPMTVSTIRSGAGLRPPYWRLRGARAGSSSSMNDHNSSLDPKRN